MHTTFELHADGQQVAGGAEIGAVNFDVPADGCAADFAIAVWGNNQDGIGSAIASKAVQVVIDTAILELGIQPCV
ncbi:MAG: hypothetical protein J6586_10785, partial [Snodgrassella sp.]|nr:hypothetical protein [Snodgrassella sp.]